jgi:hypothetical protein
MRRLLLISLLLVVTSLDSFAQVEFHIFNSRTNRREWVKVEGTATWTGNNILLYLPYREGTLCPLNLNLIPESFSAFNLEAPPILQDLFKSGENVTYIYWEALASFGDKGIVKNVNVILCLDEDYDVHLSLFDQNKKHTITYLLQKK